MSTFEVPVVRISAVVPIDGADRIEAAIIGDYQSVVRKGQYQVGDLVIYIPEQAIVPDNLLKEMGLDGKLSGSGKNRVKACRLKSILSQGIVYNKAPDDAVEGEDFAERLNIVKWEPTVPQHMAGDVANLAFLYGKPVHYDIENIKKFNRIIEDGEMVSFTEKGHGCADYDVLVETVEYGKIKIGELVSLSPQICHVKSYDTTTEEVVYELIEGYSETPNNDDWYIIELEDGTTTKLTGNHPVFLPELGCYRNSRDINIEDVVLIDTEN